MKIRLSLMLLICFTSLLLISTNVNAAIKYINRTASAGGDGRTWGSAFNTVQAGINSAVSGDQVWVAAGTYLENITLKNGVSLYGGFTGTEAALDQRNRVINETILKGNNTANVVTVSDGTAFPTKLDGFTIRKSAGPYSFGIYCKNSSITISNNLITGNQGGGIGCNGSSVIISNNIISGNGGSGITLSNSTVTINNNIISGNTNTGSGGGIYCCYGNNAPVVISNNLISGNHSQGGGGGIFFYGNSNGAIMVLNNTICNNTDRFYGGGIFTDGGEIIVNNTIVGNSVDWNDNGGGIYCYGIPQTIKNNIIAFNDNGIYIAAGNSITLEKNCVYNPGYVNYTKGTFNNSTDIQVDPGFIDWRNDNYHLLATSPCMNNGTNTGIGADWTDMDGNPRICDILVDIGAYEYNSVALKVIYNGNSSTSGNPPVDNGQYRNGASVKVLSNTGGLAKTGYTFTGWNSQADGGGADYIPEHTLVMGAANVTLYAKWLPDSAYKVNTAATSTKPTAGTDNTIILTVMDGSGVIDTGFNGSKNVSVTGYTVAPNNSYGSLNGIAITSSTSTASVSFTSGEATIILKLNNAAAQPIKFSIAGVTNPASSLTITPGPATAASLILTQDIRAPKTNDDQFSQQPKVTLKDAYGNICVNDHSTKVTVSKKDSGSWNLTGTTNATASNGVVIFSDLGSTNTLTVNGAQLVFDATGLMEICSEKVKLPAATVAKPKFNLTSSGPYNTAQSITITCATTGASIYYYIDCHNNQTPVWALYSAPVLITQTATLKAKASMSGWNDSDTEQDYTIVNTINQFKTNHGDSPDAPDRLLTAQCYENDFSVQYNSATLRLGMGKNGKNSDLWLYYPNLIGDGAGQIERGSNIIQAKLVLTLKDSIGNTSKPYGFKIYRITDPDRKGIPYFGTDGIRNGLDFNFRDHRPGMKLPWSDTANDIYGILINDRNDPGCNLEDKFELAPAVCKAKGYNIIELDVTASLRKWVEVNGTECNQGWFITVNADSQWYKGDQLVFYGATESDPDKRPHLEISYLDSGNQQLKVVSGLTATPKDRQIDLSWTDPGKPLLVRVVRKEGMVPGGPQDGTWLDDFNGAVGISGVTGTTGNTLTTSITVSDPNLTNGTIYYYAFFTGDNFQNFSRRAWVKATPGSGVITAPTDLTGLISGYQLQLNWSNVKDANADWLIIEKQTDPNGQDWEIVVFVAPDQNQYIMDLTDPALQFKPGKDYYFRIEAVNSNNRSAISKTSAKVKTPDFLQAPTELTWEIISAGRVNLSWTDIIGESGYRVDICQNDTNHTPLWSLTLPADTRSCSVMGLNPGLEYLMKVVAVRSGEEAVAWTEVIKTSADFKEGLL